MIYVVEIIGPNGGRATKEYEAPSIRAVITAAERDLRSFPQCKISQHSIARGVGNAGE